jgi:cytochrome c oxidase subunit 3
MREANPALAEQFVSLEQQQEASRLGMWAFLATEIMFFGGLFLGYLVYRHAYPQAFAEGSKHTDVFFGTLNTAILLTSSFTMALAVHAAQEGDSKFSFRCLLFTILFAFGFLVVKGFEYHKDYVEHLIPGPSFAVMSQPKAQLFFYFYWIMTGLHGLHVLIGIGALSVIAGMTRRGKFSAQYHNPVEITGLYWHFVDLVWIYLYPLLYLIDRHT